MLLLDHAVTQSREDADAIRRILGDHILQLMVADLALSVSASASKFGKRTFVLLVCSLYSNKGLLFENSEKFPDFIDSIHSQVMIDKFY